MASLMKCSHGDERGKEHDLCRIFTKITTLEEKQKSSTAALEIAKQEVDRRLEGMNELRAQIERERGTYMTHEKYEAKHEVTTNAIRSLEKFQYLAMGALLGIQILIGFLIRFWR